VSYSHATNANITYLTDLIPGLPRAAAEAWLRCEGQAVNNPTNPLNILYYGSNARGQVGERGRFAVYTSAYRGLADAAWVVKNLSYYAHLRSVLARHPSALDAARAIEDSPWAGGHYGGKGKKDGCIVRNLGGTTGGPVVTPKPKPKPKPKYSVYKVKPGDSLSSIASAHHTTWQALYAVPFNHKVIGANPSLIHPGQKLRIPK